MENLKTELLALERRFWQAMKDRDPETAASLTDESCLITGPQGVGLVSKAQLREIMKAHFGDEKKYSLLSFKIDEDSAEVCKVSDSLAVLGYVCREDVIVDGQKISLEVVDSSLWRKSGDGRWVCAAHTEAIRGDSYGRDRKGAGSAAA